MSLFTLLATTAAPNTAAASANPFGMLMPIILLFVIMYFISIRPQQKRMKAHRQMVESLKAGDKIVTVGGIFAVVKRVEQDKIVITIAEKVDVELSKGSIGSVVVEPAITEK
ncbi:MAG: preprotein translocase subunit YajC [Lentisphaeria bacterium]